jgi:outer membrane protein OmpA-like peptidoglycan-associated protein
MKGRVMKLQLVLIAFLLAGCAADQPLGNMGHRESGTLLGAVGGAVIGAVAYDRNRTKGAVVGAVGGALAGGAVGRYMDDQKRDLEKNLSTEIKTGQARVEKLANDVVRITMTSQTAFETNSADIKSGFHSTMDKVAEVVVRYGKTTLTVVGHTDDVGSNAYNQSLSERRALSVAQYLESRRVDRMRLATAGKGETQPRSSNSTESGRQENRRVEIYVEPVVAG